MVEVQLGIDPDKHASWPQYAAALWSRLRCPVFPLVVALDPAVGQGVPQRELHGARSRIAHARRGTRTALLAYRLLPLGRSTARQAGRQDRRAARMRGASRTDRPAPCAAGPAQAWEARGAAATSRRTGPWRSTSPRRRAARAAPRRSCRRRRLALRLASARPCRRCRHAQPPCRARAGRGRGRGRPAPSRKTPGPPRRQRSLSSMAAGRRQAAVRAAGRKLARSLCPGRAAGRRLPEQHQRRGGSRQQRGRDADDLGRGPAAPGELRPLPPAARDAGGSSRLPCAGRGVRGHGPVARLPPDLARRLRPLLGRARLAGLH